MTSTTNYEENDRPRPATRGDGSPIAEKEPPTTSDFHGWTDYPLNLPIYNGFCQNMSLYSSRLTAETRKLFCPSNQAAIEMWDIFQPSDIDPIRGLAREDTLEKMLMDNKGFHFSAFMIKAWHSWDRLLITEEMLRKLLTFHQVFPDFLEVVRFFGKRTREQFSYSAGFRQNIRLKSSNISTSHSELCFTLHHVELHERELPDPWSTRHMGFYIKFDFESQSSVHINIQPSKGVEKLLLEAIHRGYFKKPHPLALHLVFLTSAMENWADYVNFLEEELMDLRKCVLLTDKDWNNSRTNGDVRISFEDYRKLQRDFRDKVLLALSLLGSNLDVVAGLQMYNTQLREQDLIPHDATFIESSQLLEHHNLKIEGMRKNLESVVRIVEGTVKLVQAFLDIRNDATIRDYSNAMQGLLHAARSSRQEALVMVELAQRTKRDSRTMRIATVVATLYLPGTFVATVFGMNLIVRDDIQVGSGIITRLVFAKEMWWFAVITLFLTGVTMGSWWLSERNLRSQDLEKAGAKRSHIESITANVSSPPVL